MTRPTATSQTTRRQRPRASQTQVVETTTLEVERPRDYAKLEERYQLWRYLLPVELLYSRNPGHFGRAHNALRDQLDCPYKSFRHDVLDGQRRWAVYALIPRGQDPPTVMLPWFRNATLAMRATPFADAPLHIVLKLLQIMTTKGTVRRNEAQRAHVYEACQPATETKRQLVGDVLQRGFEGSASELMIHALEGRRTSKEELDELRRLLDEYEGRSR